MLPLSANPDFSTLENTSFDNPYYDWDATGEATELWGKDAVDQMIENVLLTEPFERLFNLNYGSPLYLLLFENFSSIDTIMPKVFDTIEYWVPIKIDRSNTQVTPDEDNHAISFQIPYITNDGLIAGMFARRIRR